MTEFSVNKEFENLVRQTVGEQEQMTVIEEGKKVTKNNESAKNRDFFQNNNAIKKRKKRASNHTRQLKKSRNFLSNISYVHITKEDFYNQNFVFDVYALVTKNLNSFLLEKNSDFNKQEMIYMLWEECIPIEFCK